MTETNETAVIEVDEKKEIKEILEGLKPLLETGFAIAEDGKISVGDLKHLGKLLGSFGTLKDAVKIPKGFKFSDLKGADLEELGSDVLQLVKFIVELKNGKE